MHPDVRHVADLIASTGDPKYARMLEHPRRAEVRALTYAGEMVTVELDVIATADGLVCISQPRPGQAAWNAWLPSAAARPIRDVSPEPGRPTHLP